MVMTEEKKPITLFLFSCLHFGFLFPCFIFSYVAAFLYLRILDSKHGLFDHRIEGQ